MVNIKNIYKNKLLIFTFLCIEISLYFLMSIDKQNRIQEYLSDTSDSFDAEYRIIFQAFEDKAKIAFETLINKQPVKTLFKQSITANESQKTLLRKQLYTFLLPDYKKLQKSGFKQVHFHLPNNHSFLRMHQPEKYGDDLSSFRKTVVQVNKTHQMVSGFEEGIAYNGFRFVFPLFNNQDYIGSAELSFSAYTLAEYIKNDFLDIKLIINQKALVNKQQKSFLSHYTTTSIDPHFVIERQYNTKGIHLPKEKRFATKRRTTLKSFSLDTNIANTTYITTYIPIKNPITKQTDAYLIVISHGKYIHLIYENFWTIFITLSLVIALLFMRYVRGNIFKEKIQYQNAQLALNNHKLKKIIDSQDNMIIITDGENMIEANEKVIHFLGFDSFEELKKHQRCICDLFIPHKDYFHLDLVPKNENWISALLKLPHKKRVVNMLGHDLKARAFQITINAYKSNNSSIISFSDITEVLIEQKHLQYKAQHDTLTNIYNRQKIDELLIKLCQYAVRRKESVGLIMFDIDHFKRINDTYGHDVGDEVLQTITKIIKRHIREEDLFGRWGGEEFMIILRHTTILETYHKAQYLRKLLAQYHDPKLPQITASFGVTSLYKNDTLKTLVKRVDLALYEAKSNGRNCVVQQDTRLSQALVG